MLEAIKHDQKYRQAIRHADYITLTIGNNDLLQALSIAARLSEGDQVSFMNHLNNEIEKSKVYEKLIANIAEIRLLTDAPIAVYNVYNPFQTYHPLHGVGNLVLPGINGQLELLISYLDYDNLVIANANTAFGNDQATYVIDQDIHPNVEGQRKLADIGLKAL